MEKLNLNSNKIIIKSSFKVDLRWYLSDNNGYFSWSLVRNNDSLCGLIYYQSFLMVIIMQNIGYWYDILNIKSNQNNDQI